jgi:hypothetical protein
MVWGLGVVVAAYVGVRLFEVTENIGVNQKLRKLTKRVSRKQRKPRVLGGLAAPAHDETDRHKHYVTVSGVSMGTAIGRYLYPPLTIVTLTLLAYVAIP